MLQDKHLDVVVMRIMSGDKLQKAISFWRKQVEAWLENNSLKCKISVNSIPCEYENAVTLRLKIEDGE